jgi:ABC-type transport system involved in multi-copper enzyme maturation permease subunit
MSIYRTRYTRYHGRLEPITTRYQAIAKAELSRLMRDKWFRRLVLMSGAPTLILGVYIYLAAILEQDFGWNPQGLDIFTRLYDWQPWFILLMFTGFGSGMISRDLNTRALTLIFTRSVSPLQYLLGKLFSLVLCALLVTLVPGLLLATAQFGMQSSFGLWDFIDTAWRISATSGLIAVFMSSLILLLSSTLGKSSRIAGMVWLVAFICLIMLKEILSNTMGLGALGAVVSPYDVMTGTAAVCFSGDTDSLPSLVAIVVYSAFFIVALYARIQSFERAYT